jgi:hypothetical protein
MSSEEVSGNAKHIMAILWELCVSLKAFRRSRRRYEPVHVVRDGFRLVNTPVDPSSALVCLWRGRGKLYNQFRGNGKRTLRRSRVWKKPKTPVWQS